MLEAVEKLFGQYPPSVTFKRKTGDGNAVAFKAWHILTHVLTGTPVQDGAQVEWLLCGTYPRVRCGPFKPTKEILKKSGQAPMNPEQRERFLATNPPLCPTMRNLQVVFDAVGRDPAKALLVDTDPFADEVPYSSSKHATCLILLLLILL